MDEESEYEDEGAVDDPPDYESDGEICSSLEGVYYYL